MRPFTHFAIVIVLLAATSVVLAQQEIPLLTQVRHYWGAPVSAVLNGDAAYVSTTTGELVAFDISDRSNPREAGSWLIGAGEWSLKRDGDKLWAEQGGYVRLYYLADPLSPEYIWAMRTNALILFESDGDMAIAKTWMDHGFELPKEDGLCIFSFADIRHPEVLLDVSNMSYGSPDSGPALLKGRTFYGSDMFSINLFAVSIEDPAHPAQLFQTELFVYPIATNASGTILYARGRGGLVGRLLVYDVRDGQEPQELANLPDFRHAQQLEDTLLSFLSTPTSYMGVSLANPAAPETIFVAELPRETAGLIKESSTGLAAEPNRRLNLLSFENLEHPEITAEIDTNTGIVNDVAIEGDLLAAAIPKEGLVLFNVQDPDSIAQIGSIEFAEPIIRISMSNGLLLAATQDSLFHLFGMNDPNHPENLGVFSGSGGIGRIVAFRNRFFYYQHDSGLHCLDATNPDSVTFSVVLAYAGRFAISGARLYTGSTTEIKAYDISEPSNLRLLGSYSLRVQNFRSYLVSITAEGNQVSYAYYYAEYFRPGEGGYHVVLNEIEFSDPAHPVGREGEALAWGYSEPNGFHVNLLARYGDEVLISQVNSFAIWRSDGRGRATFEKTVNCSGFARHGDYLYLATGNALNVYNCADYLSAPPNDVKPIPVSTSLSAYPNPFNGQVTLNYSLHQMGLVEIAVFDALGRQVATIPQGYQLTGSHHFNWNAEGLPSGQYQVVLSQRGERTTNSVVLVR